MKKTQVILAAGGKGTRIQSLNDSVPKPMIPICGKPIIQWEIESLISQGYTEFIITVSYKKESIMDYLGDGTGFGCHIEYYVEEWPLGNFGAVYKLWEEGRLEDTFLFLIADAIFDFDVDRMLAFHNAHNALATLFVHPNSHPYDSGLVMVDDNDRITGWLNKEEERPKYYKNTVNAGLQVLTTELLSRSGIPASQVGISQSYNKIDLDRDVLKPLISGGEIYAYRSSEYVKDAGTLDRFRSVEKDLSEGRVNSKRLDRKQKAIFLDRDGTINRYVGLLRNIDQFELINGVAEAIRMINNSGYLAIVITNQPVIARGEVSWEELDMIHNKMETLLGGNGAYLDGIYVCPHHPDKGFDGEAPELKIECECRKPKPGLILKAVEDFNIDLTKSYMIGDSWRDVECGNKAGCKTVLLTGDSSDPEGDRMAGLECVKTEDLLSAVKGILTI